MPFKSFTKSKKRKTTSDHESSSTTVSTHDPSRTATDSAGYTESLASTSLRSTGSSTLAETIKDKVRERDGMQCVVCGTPEGLHVCHIIGRSSDTDIQVHWIRAMLELHQFMKNNMENLITLCRKHHGEFDHGSWVLLPTEEDLITLIQHEVNDFRGREAAMAHNPLSYKPRTLPPLEQFPYLAEFILTRGRTSGALGDHFIAITQPLHAANRPPPQLRVSFTPQALSDEVVNPLPLLKFYPSRYGPRIILSQRGGIHDAENRINPYAMLVHAIEALHGVYTPVDARAEYMERLVYILRTLYNRVPLQPKKRLSLFQEVPSFTLAPSIDSLGVMSYLNTQSRRSNSSDMTIRGVDSTTEEELIHPARQEALARMQNPSSDEREVQESGTDWRSGPTGQHVEARNAQGQYLHSQLQTGHHPMHDVHATNYVQTMDERAQYTQAGHFVSHPGSNAQYVQIQDAQSPYLQSQPQSGLQSVRAAHYAQTPYEQPQYTQPGHSTARPRNNAQSVQGENVDYQYAQSQQRSGLYAMQSRGVTAMTSQLAATHLHAAQSDEVLSYSQRGYPPAASQMPASTLAPQGNVRHSHSQQERSQSQYEPTGSDYATATRSDTRGQYPGSNAGVDPSGPRRQPHPRHAGDR